MIVSRDDSLRKINGYGPWLKWPERDTIHLPPNSVEIKNI